MTVSPITKNGRRQYRASYVDGEGRQRRRFFATRAAAKAFANEWQGQQNPAWKAWLNLPPADQVAALAAIERARRNGYTLTDALNSYEQSARVTIDKTANHAWTEYLATKAEKGLRTDSIKNTRIAKGFIQSIGKKPVSTITIDQINNWIRSHEWSPSTRNSFLTQLSVFLNWSVLQGYSTHNPAKAIPRAIIDAGPVGILTTAQASRLMEACSEHDPGLIMYAALGLFCGIRPVELSRLQWSEVDLKAVHIDIGSQTSKTRTARFVTIRDQVREWITTAPKSDIYPANFRRRWHAVRQRAKLLSQWSPDCMRHAYASHAIPIWGTREVAAQCGNDERVLIKHYRRPLPIADCEKYFAIRPK